MRIHGKGPGPVTPAQRSAGVAPAGEAGAPPVRPAAVAPRTDSVQISDAGRAKVAQMVGGPAAAGRAELTPERVGEIRRRVLERAYDSLGVVDEVARRLLASGDLSEPEAR